MSPDSTRTRFPAALAIVAGSMIGTGVFASLGFQAAAMPSGFPILLLWLAGGVLAFCGAVNYAELTAAFPRSGGEYQLLSQVYHPGVGFVSGWVSMIGGFPAPAAAAALITGHYACSLLGRDGDDATRMAQYIAAGLITCVTGAHLVSVRFSGQFQSAATLLKALLVAAFALCGFLLPQAQPLSFLPQSGDAAHVWSPAFFGSLVYVLYAYSGWNAAAYIAGEVTEPQRNVPRALLMGTGIVMVLYLAVNAAMLYATPVSALAAAGENAAPVAAGYIFGPAGGAVASALIGLGLISTISAMTWAGPRVTQQMGRDYPSMLGWLGRTSAQGVPRNAVLLQYAVTVALIFAADAPALMRHTTFLLEMVMLLTVFGVIHLRIFRPGLERPVRAWGYPFTTILYLGAVGFTMAHLLRTQFEETRWGMGILLLGTGFYFAVREPAGRTRST